jgi:ABC-type bacteriocin/lantibiotic exporter with double-glycine peptidase domain
VLAQALLRKPDVLLIDEGTSHLDSKSQDAVIKELDRIKESSTVIMTAHRLRTCIEADNIVVMKAGKIIEQGNHKCLLERKGEYWNLWQSESKEIDKTLEV